MKFDITVEALQSVLNTISAVAKPNSDGPEGYVVIDAVDDKLIFLAHAGGISITSIAEDFNITEEGKSCASYAKLSSFINSFKVWNGLKGAKKATINADEAKLVVSVETVATNDSVVKSKLTLQQLPSHKVFVPEPFKEATFTINSIIFRDAISKVLYAINPNFPKAFIRGMHVDISKEFITFVGTDSLKLSTFKVKNTGSAEGSYTIPYQLIIAIKKLLKDDTQVMLEITDTFVKAVIDSTVIHGVLSITDTYPDYKSVLNNYKHKITIYKDAFLNCFAPFLNVLNVEDNKRITIELSNKTMKIYSAVSEAIYRDNIDFEGDFIIDINAQFLYNTVDSIKDDTLDIFFSDENGVLIIDSNRFGDQKSLVTPLRRRNK